MRTTPSFEHTAGTSGAYTYQVLVSNQALYYHTLSTDTNKDSPNMSVVAVGGPSIASRNGEAFVLSAHTSTNVAFNAELA